MLLGTNPLGFLHHPCHGILTVDAGKALHWVHQWIGPLVGQTVWLSLAPLRRVNDVELRTDSQGFHLTQNFCELCRCLGTSSSEAKKVQCIVVALLQVGGFRELS